MSPANHLKNSKKYWVPDPNSASKSRSEDTIYYPVERFDIRCQEIEDLSYWFIHRNRCILQAICNYPPRNPFLDVGGGNGYVTKMLQNNGVFAILVEPAVAACQNAFQHRGIEQIVCAPLEKAGFKKETAGSIGVFDMIEHLPNDRFFIEQAFDILSENGLLFITVPACPWLKSYNDLYAGHFRRYTKSSLTRLLDNRFSVLYCSHIFGLLVLPLFFFRSLPFRLGLTKKRRFLTSHVEHGIKKPRFTKFILRLLEHEVSSIANGQENKIGSSLLCVAQKK